MPVLGYPYGSQMALPSSSCSSSSSSTGSESVRYMERVS